ncbi:hypothetical protein ACOMHN_035234 [Nucella lapillus]
MKGAAELAGNLKQFLPHPSGQHYEDAVPLEALPGPQNVISLRHHMAHNPGMDQRHMVDLAHPLDVVLVALEFPPSPP